MYTIFPWAAKNKPKAAPFATPSGLDTATTKLKI
jgi:hypothetical protein